jgi:flagellar FliL protein
MAGNRDEAAAASGADPGGGKSAGKKKLVFLIVVGAVLLAAGSGAAAYFVFGRKADDGAAEARATPRKSPVFVDLETFTVNLHEPDDDRFLQVKVVLELKDAKSGDLLKNLMPSVRNEVLLLLGSKRAQDLAGREGKEQLAQQIVAAANKALAGTAAEGAVENVNFTHLIVQ